MTGSTAGVYSTFEEHDSIQVRTDAAILAVPNPPGIKGMYAEAYSGTAGREWSDTHLAAAMRSEKQLLIARLEWRDGPGCFYCLREIPPGERTIDHWVPLSADGPCYLTNLRLACRRCNEKKGRKVPTVDAHQHLFPHDGADPARCFRCLLIRPAVPQPVPVLVPPPQSTPKIDPALAEKVNGQRSTFQQRKVAEKARRQAEHLARQERERQEALARKAAKRRQHEKTAAGRVKPGGRLERHRQRELEQSRWLDDGGAVHPAWDNFR